MHIFFLEQLKCLGSKTLNYIKFRNPNDIMQIQLQAVSSLLNKLRPVERLRSLLFRIYNN